MEVNLNLVKTTSFKSLETVIDPQYLSGLVNALHTSLESGHGTTILKVRGRVPLLELISPLTYIHFFKLARWLGFLAEEKIRFVYQAYTSATVMLDAKVVEEMTVWIRRCKTFLESLIGTFPSRKIKHLPWGEETKRWTLAEQMRNILAEYDWSPPLASPYKWPDMGSPLLNGQGAKEEQDEWELV